MSIHSVFWTEVTFDPNEFHEPKQPTYKCSSETVLIYHWETASIRRHSGDSLISTQSLITKYNCHSVSADEGWDDIISKIPSDSQIL